jgi:hypothetical protein
MRTLLTPDAVPEFNLKQIDDSSLCFGWFTHREQRKVARSIPVAVSASQRVRCPTLQRQRSVAWRTELTQDSPRLEHRRNERIRFKLSRKLTGCIMTEFQYLQEQAARAERLAQSILDAVTVERLRAFAAECRAKAKLVNAPEPTAA